MPASTNTRPCRGCGNPFTPAKPFHRLCWTCWGEHNRAESSGPRAAHEGIAPALPILDSRTLKAAVALCHPDSHPPERAERATRVTQELTVALARTRELEAAA